MKKAIGIPLSLAVIATIGSADFSSFTFTANEWKMVGSDKVIDIDNLVQQSSVNSVWAYDTAANKWKLNSSVYNPVELGYEKITASAPMQGLWVKASSTGGTPTFIESGDSATSFTTVAGWNLLAIGKDNKGDAQDSADGVVFAGVGVKPSTAVGADTGIALFKDIAAGLRVYRYGGSTTGWQVWSPNILNPAPSSIATGLSAYEGFWAFVTQAKTYSTSGWDASTDGNQDFDIDDLVINPANGDDADAVDRDNPVDNFDAIKNFDPNSVRIALSSTATVEQNATVTARTLQPLYLGTANELNSTNGGGTSGSTPTHLELNVSDLLNWNAFESNQSGAAAWTYAEAGIIHLVAKEITSKGFFPTILKARAAELRRLIDDINESVNGDNTFISRPVNRLTNGYASMLNYEQNITGTATSNGVMTTTDANGLMSDYASATNGVGTITCLSSGSGTNPSGTSCAAANIQDAQNSLDNVKSAIRTAKVEMDTVLSLAQELTATSLLVETGLRDFNDTRGGKVATFKKSVAPKPAGVEQVAKWFVQAPPNIVGLYQDVNGDTVDENASVIISITPVSTGVTTEITIGGPTTTNAWNGAEANSSTLLGVGVADADTNLSLALEASAIAATFDIIDLNISGIAGTGDFSVSAAFYNTKNTAVTTDDGLVEITDGAEFNVSRMQDYVASATVIPQTSQITLSGTLLAGDIIDIQLQNATGVTSVPGDLAAISATTIASPTTTFWDGNKTYTVQASDVSTAPSTTLSNVATNLASAIAADGNLSATASGNVITVITDGNDSVNGIEYTITTVVNNMNFDPQQAGFSTTGDLLSTFRSTAKETIAYIDANITQVARDYNESISNLDAAYAATAQSFGYITTGEGADATAIYRDNSTRLLWNITGVSTDNACATSIIGGVDGWRAPSVPEMLSLFDASTQKVSTLVRAIPTSVFANDSYEVRVNDTTSTPNTAYYTMKVGDGNITSYSVQAANAAPNANVKFACVADFYDNGESINRFNDFYYYTDPTKTTNRLYDNTITVTGALSAVPVITDRVLEVHWLNEQNLQNAANWDDGKTDKWSVANEYCTEMGFRLPTQPELRALGLYNLKAHFDTSLSVASNGLSRTTLFDKQFADDRYYWSDTNATVTSVYVVPVGRTDLSTGVADLFTKTESAEVVGGPTSGHGVVCVRDQ